MKQFLMSIKTQESLQPPLFTSLNIQPNGTMNIFCNISFKKESQTLIAHLPINSEVIFGSVVCCVNVFQFWI